MFPWAPRWRSPRIWTPPWSSSCRRMRAAASRWSSSPRTSSRLKLWARCSTSRRSLISRRRLCRGFPSLERSRSRAIFSVMQSQQTWTLLCSQWTIILRISWSRLNTRMLSRRRKRMSWVVCSISGETKLFSMIWTQSSLPIKTHLPTLRARAHLKLTSHPPVKMTMMLTRSSVSTTRCERRKKALPPIKIMSHRSSWSTVSWSSFWRHVPSSGTRN